jgi:hypothetical protein
MDGREAKGARMAATEANRHAFRELAHRTTDGLEVTLFWRETTSELSVSVSDERSGAYFELATEPHEALDVFYHPYSYAAFKGVPYDDALLASWAQAAAA